MKYFDDLTIDKIRRGYYTAVYFNRTKEILLKEKNLKRAIMQVFQKKEGSILAGVEEVKELLKAATGYFEKDKWINKSEELEVKSLSDGDRISSWETVMFICGPYAYFAHLESLYLGILARRTLVASNVRKCVEAAKEVPIIFFADRFDYFSNQTGDGYAARIGGASAVCTEAMSEGFGDKPVGTIPHSLIALNDGDTVEAAELFQKFYPEVNLIALVDFDNDCVRISLAVARKMGRKLWGVRLDTAGEVIDKSLNKEQRIPPQRDPASGGTDNNELYGVNSRLVGMVRRALDREGFNDVKIIVSGGFNPEKIKQFADERVSVDGYGIGSNLIHGENDFTADIVKVEEKDIAKVGRKYKENKRFPPTGGERI